MPRKSVPMVPDAPYHVTARCINKEWFRLPLPTVWSIMEDYLYFVAGAFQVNIHAFVLMSNHFHLIITSPRGNLSETLLYFMRETSREISRTSGRINQTYGTRNHKSCIGNHHYFMNTYKYVYRNPVRAGVVSAVEEYPYSTLHGACGLSRLIIPLVEDTILFSPDFDQGVIDWLNTSPDPAWEQEVRLALRKPSMDFNTDRKTGRPSDLEKNLL